MNYQNNSKFFRQRANTVGILISFGIVAVGLLCGLLMHGYLQAMGFGLAMVGGVCMVIVNSVTVKGTDVDEDVTRGVEAFKERLISHFQPFDPKSVHNKNAVNEKKTEAAYYGTFCYDEDGLLVKKGSDSKFRSSVYAINGLIIEEHTVQVGTARIHLVDADDTETMVEFAYADLDRVCLEAPEVRKYESNVIVDAFCFYGKNGEKLLSFPIVNDNDADLLVKNLTARIERHKA